MNHSNCLLANRLLANRLLVVFLTLAAVMAAGCQAAATRNSAVANSNAVSPASGATTSTDAQALDGLTKSMSAQLNAKSFRARLDSTFNNQEMARTIEYVSPDRFRMVGETDETLLIGSD